MVMNSYEICLSFEGVTLFFSHALENNHMIDYLFHCELALS